MIAWRHYPYDANSGVARGYLSSAYFLYHTLRAVLGPGLFDCIDMPAKPRVHLHYCPPHLFIPTPDKFNVLFTMWEGDVLPDYVVHSLRMADQLLVPSTYCQTVWASHGLKAEVVPLGLAQEYILASADRGTVTARRLRFTGVGSMIGRKGWDLLAAAWEFAFGQIHPDADVELYIKTIGTGQVTRHFGGRIIIDQRDFEPVDMLKLYMSSDVVVSSSYGEGFGLPILEGMAAGCLAVAPHSGGLADFVGDDTALLVKRSEAKVVTYGENYKTQIASPKDLGWALAEAYKGWGTPEIEKLRQAGTTLAKRFSWVNSIHELLRVVSPSLENVETA